jgi:NADPH-dependent 2,4-dienoyl-CoA reductase/sulfur reductase-like enzyme/nitrite reductase/ring-hydroxylating ferredoxin subunit
MEARVATLSELADGQIRTVKVGARPVLLIRLGEELHALPARCTHHPRPLAKGLLHGGRLMCPSHQAAFDVRTGDALEPPALDALPKFSVRVDGNDVYVDVPEGEPDRRPMPMWSFDPAADRRLFAIVGAGGAGGVAAETLRQAGFQGRIVMISREEHVPYDRPHCSEDYIAGRLGREQLPLRQAEFYEEHHIERWHRGVREVDVPARTILFKDGEQLVADGVLIATGGTPNVLDIPGKGLPGVRVLRSWDDSDEIVSAADRAERAVILGAGFVGLEVAAGLRHRGLPVTIVAPESLPLGPALGDRIGALVRDVHENKGVEFRLGRVPAGLLGDGHVHGVRLDDGEVLPADLVIMGIGVRPATGIVRGLELLPDGGISVDEELRAAPGVWAVGDVAAYPDPYTGRRLRIEHWRTAQQQGKAAAWSMAGKGRPFGGVPFFWTNQFNLAMAFVGHLRGWDDIVFDGDVERREFTAFYFAGNRLLGAGGTRGTQLGAFAELVRAGGLPPARTLRDDPGTDLVALLKETVPAD